MTLMSRTLSPVPVTSLEQYLRDGGGRGLAAAREVEPEAVIAEVEESGLRARGGAGIPCGPKWRTVRAYGVGAAAAPSVVVNAAEGEPGSFKDRAILLRNPYRVLEGALIAARAVGASDVIIALKRMHTEVQRRTDEAIDAARAAGWLDGTDIQVFEGPNEYLYGEETAMLEAIDGRPPFPRIAPPYRRGVHEIVDRAVDVDWSSASAALVELAGPSRDAVGSPALVNNVETLANVPAIMVEGPEWFRSVGTRESPGSLVCTVTGATRRHGVGEVPMGTPLQEVLRLIGGGPNPGRVIKAVMGGAATPLLTADLLDTPVSIEGIESVGGRLGCGGFIVFDDRSDMAAVAEGVARFLSIESCGLCMPCKEDGMALADLFGRVRRSQANDRDLVAIKDRLRTVVYGARCNLATQYQLVLQSVLDDFADEIDAHVHGSAAAAAPELIASVVDIDGPVAVLDESHPRKQPDWTFEDHWSGKFPADRLSTTGRTHPV
jgi:NADH:ubiquinone oxidoreductase subunit F (NADH-binding)